MELALETHVGMSPESWTTVLPTFQTAYVGMSIREAQALSQACDEAGDDERSEIQASLHPGLARLDLAIADVSPAPGSPAFVKLSTRSPKDVVFEDATCARMRIELDKELDLRTQRGLGGLSCWEAAALETFSDAARKAMAAKSAKESLQLLTASTRISFDVNRCLDVIGALDFDDDEIDEDEDEDGRGDAGEGRDDGGKDSQGVVGPSYCALAVLSYA
eukprot:g5547.t1